MPDSDDPWHVCYQVARSSGTPSEALLKLSNDESETVSSEAQSQLRSRGEGEEIHRRREEFGQSFIDRPIALMLRTLAQGRISYLFWNVYMPSDYWVNNQLGGADPNPGVLFCELDGWEVLITIP